MKLTTLMLCVPAALLLSGCVMCHSTLTFDTEAKIQYRTVENTIRGSSNTTSNAATSDGGGTVTASIPASALADGQTASVLSNLVGVTKAANKN